MKYRYLFLALGLLTVQACKITENIQDGQTAYALKKYALATELLQKDFNKAETQEEKARIAFEIGESFEYNNNYENAATWYDKAFDLNYGSEAMLKNGYMLKAQEKYPEAIKKFQQYLQEEPYRRPEITLEMNACQDAIQWLERQNDPYERDTYVTNVKQLNSGNADFNPVLFQTDKIVITSSRSTSTGENTDTWTGDKYYDLYVAQRNGFLNFTSPELFKGPFNSEYNAYKFSGRINFNNKL